jgi:hypothetical protein
MRYFPGFPVLLLLPALGLSCASVSFSPGEVRQVPEDYFGMAHAGSSASEREYALLDELGAVWIRKTFEWEEIEPEPGVWDFSKWDAYVDEGKRAGKKILAVLAYDTGWIYGEKKPRQHITPEKIPYFLEYAEQVVRRYRGRIDAFEIWNEPNNPFYFWKGPRKDFYELSRATARKIKEIDPEIKVVAGSLWLVSKSFIRGMFDSGAMEQVDAISFHPYAGSPRGVLRSYDRLVRIVGEYNFTGEIWVTEIGYPTRGIYPGFVNQDNYPEYIVKTLAGLAARGGRTLFWYELFDKYNQGEAPSALNPSLYFGLVYPNYSPKPGGAAYALCARYLAGKRHDPAYVQGLSLPASVEALFFRGEDNGDTLVLWNNQGGPQRLRIPLPETGAFLHDPVTGKSRAVFPETELVLDRMPQILTWGPAA